MIKKQKIKFDFDETVEIFVDTETGEEYRRILCGFAWPYGNKQGFAVVLGEDWEPDFSGPAPFAILIRVSLVA